MSDQRYEKGMELLKEMVGADVLAETVEKVSSFDSEFADYVVKAAFGEVWARPELDLKYRSTVTISSMVTQGAVDQIDFHIHAGLNNGLTPQEIVEIIMHCVPYVGFPRSLGALMVVKKVFEERNISFKRE